MRTPELIDQLGKTMALLTESNDELRDLDQVLGDGDLGVTVTAGAKAIIEAWRIDYNESRADMALANASPSRFAQLARDSGKRATR